MEASKSDIYLDLLENGRLYKFNEWSTADVPSVCAGVYTIWEKESLIYVGMAGRALNAEIIENHRNSSSKSKGLKNRLKSHASGRRSGDQFCVYVSDLIVLPMLSQDEIIQISKRQLKFDDLIKKYIHTHLSYRYTKTEDATEAFYIENLIKSGHLKAGKPLLNPSF